MMINIKDIFKETLLVMRKKYLELCIFVLIAVIISLAPIYIMIKASSLDSVNNLLGKSVYERGFAVIVGFMMVAAFIRSVLWSGIYYIVDHSLKGFREITFLIRFISKNFPRIFLLEVVYILSYLILTPTIIGPYIFAFYCIFIEVTVLTFPQATSLSCFGQSVKSVRQNYGLMLRAYIATILLNIPYFITLIASWFLVGTLIAIATILLSMIFTITLFRELRAHTPSHKAR